MSSKFGGVLLALVTFGLFTPTVRAQIEAEQVRTAIDRGVEFLSRQQRPNGSWPDLAGTPGGLTSLATLALLNSGVSPSDDRIQRALAYLRKLDSPDMTYCAALQIMVFAAAEPKKDMFLIRRNARWLEQAQLKKGRTTGAWTYRGDREDANGDNSNSQFALLGLYEAQRAGVAIEGRAWRLAQNYWQSTQHPSGWWGYTIDQPASGSMTCAGIAAMVITSGEISRPDAEVVGDQVHCCGQQQGNDAVENGINWLKKNFSVDGNPAMGAKDWLYYLYGLERTGRMTNRRFIGDHDWYREGADRLIRTQDSLQGSWIGEGPGQQDPSVGTALALLFLAKGRRPIVIAKLKHEPDRDWNNHRSDVANLTTYVEKRWSRDLTWQVVDSAGATVDDLLQAPVVFISGRRRPEFTADEISRLRDFVARGGFIFAEACCDGQEFAAGFRDAMARVFPEEEYRLKPLEPEHPIWRAEEPISPGSRYAGQLEGINVGCRTAVVLCPLDLSCYWELSRGGLEREYPEAINRQVEDARALGINVLAYATNRELKWRYEGFTSSKESNAADAIDRGKLRVARLRHPGGCNAAPGAGGNLMRLLGEKLKIRVQPEVAELAMTDPELFKTPVALMSGRQSFQLSAPERKQLRTYLERGGVLIVDSICSSQGFTNSFRREMKAIFPEHELAQIPANHPIFTADFGGDNLARVSRRAPERSTAGGALKIRLQDVEPYLEGVKLGDRYAVLFSPYDLSCALENHESLECEGYTRKDAGRIGVNLLMYGLHQ